MLVGKGPPAQQGRTFACLCRVSCVPSMSTNKFVSRAHKLPIVRCGSVSTRSRSRCRVWRTYYDVYGTCVSTCPHTPVAVSRRLSSHICTELHSAQRRRRRRRTTDDAVTDVNRTHVLSVCVRRVFTDMCALWLCACALGYGFV